MKTLPLLASFIGLSLVSCKSSSKISQDAYSQLMRQEGLVTFTPPQGNPDNPTDWNKLGPATIIRRNTFAYEQGAKAFIGADGIKGEMAPDQATDYHIFDNKSISGHNLDASGGYNLQGVGDIAGKLNFDKNTEVEVSFGKTYITQPYSIDELRQLIRKNASNVSPETQLNLRQKKSDIVNAVVYTDSMKFTFQRKSDTGASAKLTVTDKDLGDLTAKGYRTDNGSVIVPSKTFLYYRPLENAADLFGKQK